MKMKLIPHAFIASLALATAATVIFPGCAATSTRQSTGAYLDDSAITTKVKANLVNDDTVKAREVKVDTYQGVVQLSGFVDTAEQKNRAAEVAAAVPGVKDVRNNIVVKPMS
ncbi:MAG TPA: BON domain-containing protein [Opitutaceae bacterium]|nr:BON domain-containing protein [Opitutaceae bacterium]